MMRLLQAGLVAGVRQLGAVVAITLLVSLAPSENAQSGTESETFWISVSPFLAWAYIIIALGLALTIGKSIGTTAEHIHHGSHRMRLMTPEHVLVSLTVQFALCAIVISILALRTPPELLVMAARVFGWAYASIVWPAALSLGVACFGATAHAALSAYRLYRP